MKKRLIALLLTLTMVFTTLSPVGVLAETGTDLSLSLEANPESVQRGDQVKVTINLTKEESLDCEGLQFEVLYDTNVFEKPKATRGDIIQVSPTVNNGGKGSFSAGMMLTTDDNGDIVLPITSGGVLYTLTFTVKSDATLGKTEFKFGKVSYAKANDTNAYTPSTLTGASVSVVNPCTGISLDNTELTVTRGKTATIVATVEPSDATNTVEWKSSNTDVATVDENGTVTAVATGEATITATCGAESATCKITVVKPDISDITTSNSAVLTGEAVYGESLTAESDINIPYTVTWYREGNDTPIKSENCAAQGSDYCKYELTKEDIGHKIYFVITADEYAGSITSSLSDEVKKQSNGSYPLDPTASIEENDEGKLILTITNANAEGMEGAEFKVLEERQADTEGEYSNDTTFEVEYGKNYNVYARIAETETKYAGEAVSVSIRAPKAKRGFTVATEGKGTVEADKNAAATREGEVVTFTATPDTATLGQEYKFVEWVIEDSVSATSTDNPLKVTLGTSDVKVTAKFELLPEVPVSFGTENTFTYDGNAHSPVCGIESVENMTKTVEYFDSLGNKLTAEPTNAGTYTMKVTFTYGTGAEYRTTVGEKKFTIEKAPAEGTLVLPEIDTESIKSDSFAFDGDLEGAQQYAINTTGAAPAETDWINPHALLEKVASGLEPNTTYYVFTRIHANDANHYDVVAENSVSVTTAHSYSWEIVNVQKYENPINVRKDGTVSPIEITIKNTGTGTIEAGTRLENPYLEGSGAKDFTVKVDKTSIASGETLVMTVTPKDSVDTSTVGKTYTVTPIFEGSPVGSISVTITIKIVAKNKVEFSGIADTTTVEFNGQTQGIDLSNISVEDPDDYEVIYDATTGSASNLTVTYTDKNGAAVAEPRNAGTYTATIAYEDDDYIGSTTATLTIEPKEITAVLDTTATKEYDGNTEATVDTTSLKLDGAIDGTDVKIAEGDLNWNYDTANAGSDKTVTNSTAIALDGTDKDNYTLKNTAIELKGTITQKALTVTATVADKVYNGLTNDAAVTTTITGLVEGDDVKLENIKGTYASADAGDAVKVSVIYTVSGEDKDNYSFNTAAEATGKITKAELTVEFQASAGATYDGSEHTAVYITRGIADSDTAKKLFNVTYTGSTAAPVDAGTYAVSAVLTEEGSKNYTLKTLNEFNLVISNAKLTATDIQSVFAYTLTGKQTRALSDLQLTPAVDGTWSVDGTPTGNTALLTGYSVEGDNFAFTLANNKASNIGNEEVITLKFTPVKNYDSVTAKVTIRIAADTYTTSITPALPTTVKLGEALDLSGVKLVTKFGSGAADQQLDVTDSTKVKVENTYDPAATGSGAIGSKTVTFTDAENSDITYTHSFTVVDVLDGNALETSESAVSYTLGTDKLNDFNMFAKYKSGETKKLTNADVKLTFEEGMTEQSMLNTIGSHKVTATYTEKNFDNSESTQSFTFTVLVTSTSAAIDGKPNAEGFTLTPVPDKDKEMTYSNSQGDIPASDVTGILDVADDAAKSALQQEEDKNASFKTIGDNKVYEEITFTDTNKQKAEFKDGSMQVTVPYPADSTKDKTFVIILRNEDGTTETIAPTKTETGLQFTITGDTQFVIGWYDAEPEDTESNAEDSYWTEVYWALLNSRNSTVTANAGYYDKVPQGVLRAVDMSGNTLVINSAYGMQVVITPNAIEKAGSYRIYYPVSYLNQVFGGSSAVISGTTTTTTATGVTVGVLMPTTGDDTVVNSVYTMTPANAGYMVGMESVDNAKAVIDSAESVSVLEGAQFNDGAVIGGWMLVGLGLLTLVGAAYIAMRKREN